MLDYTSERISERREILYAALKEVFSNGKIPTVNKTYLIIYDVYDALQGSMLSDFNFFISEGVMKKENVGFSLTEKEFFNYRFFLDKNYQLNNALNKIKKEMKGGSCD